MPLILAVVAAAAPFAAAFDVAPIVVEVPARGVD